MAMAGGTRAVVGRATTAMATISSSLSSLSTIAAAFPSPSASPSLLRLRYPQLQSRYWRSRSFTNSVIAMSVVDTAGESATASAAAATAEIDALDIRVGRVLRAWKHPEADSLYVEEVDVAEPEGPRTICSGLVNFLQLEELEGRAVLVLANLKPRNMRGVKSNGMLLAASNSEHTVVQLLSPPQGAVAGERVWFGEETDQTNQAPAGTPNQVQKKKIWESMQPLLKTTDECVATFQSKPMRTSAGVVTCGSLQGANIS